MTNAATLRAIGQNIRAVRVQRGLTQECLAELVGIHWQTLSYIERGKYPFAITTFVAIVQHLDVRADFLLTAIPKPDPRRAARIRKALASRRKIPQN